MASLKSSLDKTHDGEKSYIHRIGEIRTNSKFPKHLSESLDHNISSLAATTYQFNQKSKSIKQTENYKNAHTIATYMYISTLIVSNNNCKLTNIYKFIIINH